MSWLYDVVFCFFKQKTAYEMRISDWSSDVCSSDLAASLTALDGTVPASDAHSSTAHYHSIIGHPSVHLQPLDTLKLSRQWRHRPACNPSLLEEQDQSGRASCRERVCQYV